MALTKCTVATDVIGSLGTTPNERGLTTQEFKDKFDEMPEGIKTYLNDTLTVEVDAHMAQTVSQIVTAQRDASLAGVQTISGLAGKPKYIDVVAIVDGTKKVSLGRYAVTDYPQYCINIMESDTKWRLQGSTYSIMIRADVSNYILGAIQNVTNGSFEVSWGLTGTLTGTIHMRFSIIYH